MDIILSGVAGPETGDSLDEVSRRFRDELPCRLVSLAASSGCEGLSFVIALDGEGLAQRYLRTGKRHVITRHISPYRWLDATDQDRVRLYAEALIDAAHATDPKRISSAEQQVIVDAIEAARAALLAKT